MTDASIGGRWSDPARVDQLKALYAEGKSASAIAVEMGFPTRNIVIGKISRLGLNAAAPRRVGRKPVVPPAPRLSGDVAASSVPTLTTRRPASRAQRIVEIARASGVSLVPRSAKRASGSIPGPPEERERVVARENALAMKAFTARAPETAIPFEQLGYAGQCKWPYGDRLPYVFCGRATQGMPLPYCPDHFFVAVQGVRRGREVYECKATG